MSTHITFSPSDQLKLTGVHIDVQTGEKIMYSDFVERIQDMATGIGAPVSQGGLGIEAEDKEMVGIMGENSSVSIL